MVNEKGQVVKYYTPKTSPNQILPDILKLIEWILIKNIYINKNIILNIFLIIRILKNYVSKSINIYWKVKLNISKYIW